MFPDFVGPETYRMQSYKKKFNYYLNNKWLLSDEESQETNFKNW